MPRPTPKLITLTIDGREIEAAEGSMLVDAAKQGDVEIPYFCYEPKLGSPVGACRMCLVEIEGIPKLQTSCSTPVREGMVVRTTTDRVKHAQNAIVEFLLVNHPLDCPVCDKGGECPLQDITFGWGLGKSRFVDPKRHFEKPLALSPLVAIDRERCILCYRCVRFSQEISEDYQLIFAERGAHTFVTTHDGHPYVAPFSGNITELCPVGALTSQPYRFRARPWDIEQAGGICTLCPSQCNVSFTVRDEKVMRVLARDNEEVDDGWLCDKGRYAYQAIHVDERITRPMVREGTDLREVSWERALDVAAGLAKHKGKTAAIAGGQATNEEGFLLQRLLREALLSNDLDVASPAPEPLPLETLRALNAPARQAKTSDLEFAHTVLLFGAEPLDESPIWDLRIRKGVRRNRVNLVIATARPSALDANAKLAYRYAPGSEAEVLAELHAALSGNTAHPLADAIRAGGEEIVIVYGERLTAAAAATLHAVAETLGAKLLALPAGANGRGLREAGVSPVAAAGYGALNTGNAGRGAATSASAAVAGEISALVLLQTDPLRDLPGREQWRRALQHAPLVVAFASVMSEGLREHATVVLPAESHAEKEGTVTHPDGRVQRLRTAIKHPGEVRATWQVLAELCKRCGLDTGALTSSMVFRQLTEAVPFLAGLTLDQIGGQGLNWTERDAASAMPEGSPSARPIDGLGAPASAAQGLRLGTYRSVWAAPEVEVSPALAFTIAQQVAELSPQDASRLGVSVGDELVVSQNGTRLGARAAIRTGVPEGTVFLADGLESGSANELSATSVEVARA